MVLLLKLKERLTVNMTKISRKKRVNGLNFMLTGNDPESMHEALKDGRILCKLMNCLDGGDIKINASNMAFKRMENIGKFLEAAAAYGVSKTDSFQTVDLYEATNMPQVINALHALGRKAASKGKRGIGPKESQENKREFSDEQLRAGEGVIGLQMGTNKGASQAGQHFGRPRQIRDS
ncbi:transgelin-2-like isoform X2 [Tubulanus polymorphus]|uniref:transgelin-2-like isoform X2 n=1 Tax=Tubulanus polymorphus TaxID=672921 RepID=UPI003DA1F5AC